MTGKKRTLCGVGLLLLFAICGIIACWQPLSPAWGQTKNGKSKRDDKTSEKSIDSRAEEVQESFIRDSVKLARDYEEAGLLEKSKQVLETVVKLKEDLPGLREKINSIDEELLSANTVEAEVDASKGWGSPVGQVYKNQTVRFQASGTYRFVTNLNLDPTGFSKRDPITDLAEGVPVGALIGMVLDKDKKTEIFLVSSATDYAPKVDGLLFLKVNLPAGHKSAGKLKVKISGNIQTR
jgi:hypothetical protein